MLSKGEQRFIETVSKGLKLLGLPKLNDKEEIKLLRRLREVNSI